MSLLDQTWKNWNVVFVDGQSDSKHINWLNQLYQRDRFKYIKQTEGYKGIFGAMNQGSEKALSSSWLLFWGSDDWAIYPNTFEKLNAEINKLSGIKLHLIVCKGKYFSLQNTFYKKYFL